MAKVRKDKRGRNLHKGEYQRPDGRYARFPLYLYA